jgi:hypothetical protein
MSESFSRIYYGTRTNQPNSHGKEDCFLAMRTQSPEIALPAAALDLRKQGKQLLAEKPATIEFLLNDVVK